MRQIVVDTETTGLETAQGHRIIEVGCVELLDRKRTDNHFHCYVNPGRSIDSGALEVHGIDEAFLASKPVFAEVATELLEFVGGAELIIHNAPFDIGFFDYELGLLGPRWGRMEDHCTVLDTLALAREKHPGQRNSLDALCVRYGVDNSNRELHGALLDAQLLSEVYLALTGGQTTLALDTRPTQRRERQRSARRQLSERPRVLRASEEEHRAHAHRLSQIEQGGAEVPWDLWG